MSKALGLGVTADAFAICSCGGILQICQWYRVCDAGALRAEPLATLYILRGQNAKQNSLARHWARDWRALALTQVHHGSRLSDSCEDGEALSSVHPPTPATGKLIHNLLCDCRVKND